MQNNKIFYFIVILILAIFFVLLLGLKEEKNYSPQSDLKKLNNSISLKELYSEKNIFLNDLLFENELNLIGINYKDNLDNSKKFLSDLGNPYDEVLVDGDGTKSIELGAIGVPETYLINNENKIIKKFIGPLDQYDYENIISLIKK